MRLFKLYLSVLKLQEIKSKFGKSCLGVSCRFKLQNANKIFSSKEKEALCCIFWFYKILYRKICAYIFVTIKRKTSLQ